MKEFLMKENFAYQRLLQPVKSRPKLKTVVTCILFSLRISKKYKNYKLKLLPYCLDSAIGLRNDFDHLKKRIIYFEEQIANMAAY